MADSGSNESGVPEVRRTRPFFAPGGTRQPSRPAAPPDNRAGLQARRPFVPPTARGTVDAPGTLAGPRGGSRGLDETTPERPNGAATRGEVGADHDRARDPDRRATADVGVDLPHAPAGPDVSGSPVAEPQEPDTGPLGDADEPGGADGDDAAFVALEEGWPIEDGAERSGTGTAGVLVDVDGTSVVPGAGASGSGLPARTPQHGAAERAQAEPPPAEDAVHAAAPVAGDEHEGDGPGTRSGLERSVAVVPPAEAWPDDVWPDESLPAELVSDTTLDLQHPVAVENEIAGTSPDLSTLGETGLGTQHTAYPPAVPDSLDSYALDGMPQELGAPSAVYMQDAPGEWDTSAAGRTAETTPAEVPRDGPIGAGRAPGAAAAVGEPRAASGALLATQLERIASELRHGELSHVGDVAGIRDSEALVVVLGLLLRAGR